MALSNLATQEMIENVVDGVTPVAQAKNAQNVQSKINDVGISEIFEEDGKTAKEATHAASADNAESANRLNVKDAVGSSTEPIYFSYSGVPLPCGKTLSVNITGNAATADSAAQATKLATARQLQVDLESNSAQQFDGTEDAEGIGVTGTLPVSNGGTGISQEPDILVDLTSDSADNAFKNECKPGVSGVLGVKNGGTGASSFTPKGIILGGTTEDGSLQSLAFPDYPGYLLSNGPDGKTPFWASAPKLYKHIIQITGSAENLGAKEIHASLVLYSNYSQSINSQSGLRDYGSFGNGDNNPCCGYVTTTRNNDIPIIGISVFNDATITLYYTNSQFESGQYSGISGLSISDKVIQVL